MRILYLGNDDAYAVRRLREESCKRRIRFELLEPKNIELTTHRPPTRFADVLVVRTQQPSAIAHALTLARLYRAAGKRVIDAALGNSLTIYSKLNDSLVLAEHGVPIPRSILTPKNQNDRARAARTLGYPLVVKGIHGAGGQRVWLAKNARQLTSLISHSSPSSLMLQEYLEAPYDFRVLVLGYKALPLLLRRYPKRGDFRTNAKFAHSVEALPISQFPNIARIAERAARILKREFTGVDLRIEQGLTSPRRLNLKRLMVLEVNRQPEFETFEKYTGLNVAGAFLDYVAEKVSPLHGEGKH